MSVLRWLGRPIIIFLIVILAGGGVLAYRNYKPKPSTFTTVTVTKKPIAEYVTATGSVSSPAKYSLSFEKQGMVKLINVKIGDTVLEGAELVTLDEREAQNALQRAKANEAGAYARLKQVTDGTKAEEIYLAETALRARELELERARALADATLSTSVTDLETTIAKATADLNSDYENGISVLRSNIGKLKQSLIVIDRIRRLYFASRDSYQHGSKIQEIQYQAQGLVDALAAKIDAAKDQASIDVAFAAAPGAIGKTLETIRYMRDIAIEDPLIRDTFPTAERTNIEIERASIEAVDTAVTNAKQNIENQIIANKNAIDAATQQKSQSAVGGLTDVTRSQSAVAEAQAQLRLKRAGARTSDLNLALAELDSARSSVKDAELGVAKTIIKAPATGIITDISVDVGEVVGASTSASPVVTMIASRPYGIEANVAEIDVSKLKVGNAIAITFDAFPDQDFSGHVSEIYPAETVVQGVIYYRIKASFEDPAGLVKPGMTANLKMVTKSKMDALVVPYPALTREGRKDFVRIPKGTEFETREVQVGIQGDTEVEIISGLKEGDQVITFIKEN